MKYYMKYFFLPAAILLLAMVSSCSKHECYTQNNNEEVAEADLITPEVSARIIESKDQRPFTGALEIYPCNDDSPIYFGNYVNGRLSVFYGFYMIVDGDVFGNYNREIHLPTGNYNMVYWGTPKYDEPIHNAPQIVSPGLTAGADVSKLYFSLRSIGDGIYSPVYDLVHAVKTAHIGTDALETSLTRVGSGLKVIVKQSDGSVFIPEIANVKVNIGGIAEKINFYTGEAENLTKTVQFELTRSEDGLTYENPTVMLFPSAEHPMLDLVITTQDGKEHRLTKELQTTLSANTRLTLQILLGEVLPSERKGNFTIENWREATETIEFIVEE